MLVVVEEDEPGLLTPSSGCAVDDVLLFVFALLAVAAFASTAA